MTEKDSENQAKSLAAQGYAIISRRHCMAARIEYANWCYVVAKHHCSWDESKGMRWVEMVGDKMAADHYRRCISKDRITVSEKVRKLMPKSGDCDFSYRFKHEPHVHRPHHLSEDRENLTFLPDLWQKWLGQEYYDMVKNKPFHLWENILMKDVIKCFHLDDVNFIGPSKRLSERIYPESTRKYWGHVITNKAHRTDRKFAKMYEPNGLMAHNLTHAMFGKLADKMEHEYVKVIPESFVTKIILDIPYLSKDQAQKLVKSLVKNSPHLENYRSEYTKFKEPRFIIIDLED
jgi:hypothetical protein